VYIYIHTHTHTHTYIYIYIDIYTHIYIYIYIYNLHKFIASALLPTCHDVTEYTLQSRECEPLVSAEAELVQLY